MGAEYARFARESMSAVGPDGPFVGAPAVGMPAVGR
jgi:hypothetical protein